MIKYLIIFLPIFIIILLGSLFFIIKKITPDYKIIKIKINEKIFEVEIADTTLKKAKGLSGRKCLKNDEGVCSEPAEGMLFLFAKPTKQSFWMAGMNFPIDIIWINGNKIVDISKNVQPPKNYELPAIVSPSIESNKVLELSAGAVEKFNIKINDMVEIK